MSFEDGDKIIKNSAFHQKTLIVYANKTKFECGLNEFIIMLFPYLEIRTIYYNFALYYDLTCIPTYPI